MVKNQYSHHKYLRRAKELLDQGMKPVEVLNSLAEHDRLLTPGTDMRRALYTALYSRTRYEPVKPQDRKSHPHLDYLYPAIRDLFKRGYNVKAVAQWLHEKGCGARDQIYGVAYRLKGREFPTVMLRLHYIRAKDIPGWQKPVAPTPVRPAPEVDFNCD